MSQEIDVFHHKELQELAIHYKTLNWTLHGIFVPMHIGLIGFLATAMITHETSTPADILANAVIKLKSSPILHDLAAAVLTQQSRAGSIPEIGIVEFGCVSGIVLIWAWRTISNRQRGITTKLYKRLHELESYMKGTYTDNPQGFDVHVLVAEFDRIGWRPTTRTIFTVLRWLMAFAYFFIAYNVVYGGNLSPIGELARWTIQIVSKLTR